MKKAWHSLTLWFNGLLAFIVVVIQLVSFLWDTPDVSDIIPKNWVPYVTIIILSLNWIIRKYHTTTAIGNQDHD
jgi:hypothetical protein